MNLLVQEQLRKARLNDVRHRFPSYKPAASWPVIITADSPKPLAGATYEQAVKALDEAARITALSSSI